MIFFLAIQSTYDAIELGLFEGDRCVERVSISKIDASRFLISTLDALLKNNDIAYTNLSFCVVSQGPGPFTTLRTVIASMNGLAYATGVPLVGVNALVALIQEYDPIGDKNVCALLQAFGGDVYMGLKNAGCDKVDIRAIAGSEVCMHVEQWSTGEAYIIGNGVGVCMDSLKQCVIGRIHYAPEVLHSSLSAIARCGFLAWQNGDRGALSIRPIYLKNHPAQS